MTGERQVVVQDGTEVAVSTNYAESGVVVAGNELDPVLVERWGNLAAHFHARSLAAISAALDFCGPEDAPAVIASFDQLPEGARMAIFDGLGVGTLSKHHVKPSGDEAEFLKTRTGAILAQRWGTGNRAEFKLAMADRRMMNMLSNMSDDDAIAAENWLKAMPPDLEAAIWVALAEG